MKIIYTLILFLLVSCDSLTSTPTYRPTEKAILANQIRQKAAYNIQKKTGLIPFGSGGGTMHNVRMLALAFNYYKPVDITTSRKLVLTAHQELLDQINRNEKIRKYLIRYPFPPENVQIRIFFRNPDGSNPKDGQICVTSIIEGKIKYKTNDPNYKLFKTLAEESYMQALKKS